MGTSGTSAAEVGRRQRRRRGVMSEINVTPMVDVMLVLLIIFMVSAPLLTVGVPIDLPQSQAKSLDQDKEPLTISVNGEGKIFLQNTEIGVEDLVAKLSESGYPVARRTVTKYRKMLNIQSSRQRKVWTS